MIKEFKEFIAKGNVLDLAGGFVIGGAFGKIIESLVKDILTPLLTPITSRAADFASYKLGPFAIGDFVNNAIQFLLMPLALFLVVKVANRLRRPVEVHEVADPQEVPVPIDYAAQNAAQNEQIIALLKQLAAKS